MALDVFHLEELLWMVTEPVGSPTYDFEFERFFRCAHPYQRPDPIHAIARVGARADYAEFYQTLQRDGIQLLHTPEIYDKCSDLRGWYPLLEDLTARTLVFDDWPDPDVVSRELGWPVFLKGVRQTSRHQLRTSRVSGPEALASLRDEYRGDRILQRQPVACRAWLSLRSVPDPGWNGIRIPASFEYRCFFWNQKLVGFGKYWVGATYTPTRHERQAACRMAQTAADRMQVPFLVVDVAQQMDGSWVVIECNDGQESGYAGCAPVGVWNEVLAVIRN